MDRFAEVNEHSIRYMLATLPQVVFEVTESCNLRCAYCALSDLYENGKGRDGRKMSSVDATAVLDYLFCLWAKEAEYLPARQFYVSFYGGEPLLNFPLIEEIVWFVESNRAKIKREVTFSMTTNGLLLDKYIDYLYEINA